MIKGISTISSLVLLGVAVQQPAFAAGDDKSEAATADSVELKEPVPSRFGDRPVDEAYGAFQRGYYVTARNLAMPRAEAGDGGSTDLAWRDLFAWFGRKA